MTLPLFAESCSVIMAYPLEFFNQGQNITIYHEYEGGIEKSVPRITVWHHEVCRVMTNGDHEGRIFLTRIMDSLSCSPLDTAFYVLKMLPEVHEYAEMQHDNRSVKFHSLLAFASKMLCRASKSFDNLCCTLKICSISEKNWGHEGRVTYLEILHPWT